MKDQPHIDFISIIFTMLTKYWYIWLLLIIILIIKQLKLTPKKNKNKLKGQIGETIVTINHSILLNKNIYHTLENVTLPMFDSGTTQIDHIIVSIYGIFIIETKNFKGWIFGKEHDATWTQKFPNKSIPFQNPLNQNYGHIKTISKLLKIPEEKFHSIVVFVGNCKFKTPMPDNVLLKDHTKYIKSKTEKILTEEKVTDIIKGVTDKRRANNEETRREHEEYVKNIKENYPQTKPLYKGK